MKKQRNHSKLKEQEKSPERTNNETDLSSLPDPKFKREVIKTLKELESLSIEMQITVTRNQKL